MKYKKFTMLPVPRTSWLILTLCAVSLVPNLAQAESLPTQGTPEVQLIESPKGDAAREAKGPVTHLPIPRFVSLKSEKTNARRGPSLTHRIDWVYKRRNLPVQVVAEHGHWRKIRDHDGMGGWVHFRLLSGYRYAMFNSDDAALYLQPNENSNKLATVDRLVVGKLVSCADAWCKIKLPQTTGWAPASTLWGVDADETFE